MSSDGFELFTRKDVLEGLFGGHARAASTVLFAIESRTAHLVAQSQQAMERFLTEEAAEKRELAFLEAMALGREPPSAPRFRIWSATPRSGRLWCRRTLGCRLL